MKLVLSAIVTLAAVAAFATEAKKEVKHETATTTAPATAAAPAATTTPTTKEEKKAASATVDCKDTKNKDKAECKHGMTH